MEDQHNRCLEKFEEWITELQEGNLHENLSPTPSYHNVEPENNHNYVGWEHWNIEELLQGLGGAEQNRMIVKELNGGFVQFDESEVLKLITSLKQFFFIEDHSTTVLFLVKIVPHLVDKYRIGGQWEQYVDKYGLKDGDKIEFSISNLNPSIITARRM